MPARKHFSPWRPAPAPAPAPAGTGGRGGAAGGPQGCPLTLSVQPPGPDPPSRVAGVAAQTFLLAQSRDSSPITGHSGEKSSSLGLGVRDFGVGCLPGKLEPHCWSLPGLGDLEPVTDVSGAQRARLSHVNPTSTWDPSLPRTATTQDATHKGPWGVQAPKWLRVLLWPRLSWRCRVTGRGLPTLSWKFKFNSGLGGKQRRARLSRTYTSRQGASCVGSP